MCPVDLARSLGQNMGPYMVGAAVLPGYRLGFYRISTLRQCGVLDVIRDRTAQVQGVLYRLPLAVSPALDRREYGYHRESVTVSCGEHHFANTRTYTVSDKLSHEQAPNSWYFGVVMRGALRSGLPQDYCQWLYGHMYQLQLRQSGPAILR